MMKLSVSKINTFLEDPRKYWYVYEMGIKTPKSEGYFFGSAVHEGLENYYNKKDPMQGVSRALFGKKSYYFGARPTGTSGNKCDILFSSFCFVYRG